MPMAANPASRPRFPEPSADNRHEPLDVGDERDEVNERKTFLGNTATTWAATRFVGMAAVALMAIIE